MKIRRLYDVNAMCISLRFAIIEKRQMAGTIISQRTPHNKATQADGRSSESPRSESYSLARLRCDEAVVARLSRGKERLTIIGTTSTRAMHGDDDGC